MSSATDRFTGTPWAEVLVSLAIPAWLLGADMRIFAPAHWLALAFTAGGAVAWCAVMLLWRRPRRRRLRLALALTLVCLPLLVLPLADPLVHGAGASDRPAQAKVAPEYNFLKANGNPHAFNAWWTLFFDAWRKIQPKIVMKDPAGLLRSMPIPNADQHFLWGEVKINNLGFRGRDIPPHKGNEFRIVTLGASPTFGQSVFQNSKPWSAVLEDLIAERYKCRKPVRVINAGVDGYRITDSINRLRRDIAPLKPDLVISYHGYNGMKFIVDDLPKVAAPTLPPEDAGAATQAWLHLDFFMRSAWDQLRGLPAVLHSVLFGRAPLTDMKKLRKSAYYGYMEQLIDTAEGMGADVALATYSMAVDKRSPEQVLAFYRIVFHNNMPGLTWMRMVIDGMAALNRMIEDLGRRHPEIQVIDTRPGLNGEFDKNYFLDIVHFTPTGDRKMAENVLASLQHYLISKPELSCRPK